MSSKRTRSRGGSRAVGWSRIPVDLPDPLEVAFRAIRDQTADESRNNSRTHAAAAISLYCALPPNVRTALREYVYARDHRPAEFEWHDALNVMIDTYLGDESQDGRVLHIGNTTYRIERVAS